MASFAEFYKKRKGTEARQESNSSSVSSHSTTSTPKRTGNTQSAPEQGGSSFADFYKKVSQTGELPQYYTDRANAINASRQRWLESQEPEATQTPAPQPVRTVNALERLSRSAAPVANGQPQRITASLTPSDLVRARMAGSIAMNAGRRPEQSISNSRGDTEILPGEPANLTREGQWAAKHPIAGTVMYGVSNLVGGAEGLVNTGEAALRALATGQKFNPNNIHSAPIAQGFRTGAAEGFRREAQEEHPRISSAIGIDSNDGRYTFGEKAMDFLTGVGADAVSSGISMATGGPVSTALMGGSAANQALYETSQDQNTTARQAVALATANGIAEAFFEHFSIERLMHFQNPTSTAQAVRAALAQAGVEASEEMATEIANTISDIAIRRGNSERGREYQDRLTNGEDPNSAARNTAMSAVTQVLLSGLGGALSGGLHTGMAMYGNTLSNGMDLRRDIRNGITLEDIAGSIDTSTAEGQRVQNLANNIAQREAAGRTASTAELGYLNNAIDNASQAAMENEARERAAEVERANEELGSPFAVYDPNDPSVRAEEQHIRERFNVAAPDVASETTPQESIPERQTVARMMNDVAAETANDTSDAFRFTDYYNSQRMTPGERIFNAEMSQDMASTFEEEGRKAFSALPAEEGVKAYREWAAHYNSMRLGIPVPQNIEHNLSPEQISAAMRAGALDLNRAYPQDTMKAVNRAVNKIKVNGVNAGVADRSGINYNSLTPQQKLRVDYTEAFVTKGLGMDVRYVQSDAVDGKYRGMNGSFQVINGRPTMTLDVNAGMNRESDWTGDITDIKTMLPVISHETTHFLEQYNPKLYKELSSTVLAALQNSGSYSKGMTINSIIEAERKRLNETIRDENGNPVQHSQEDAIHELVARACEDMLSGDKKALDAFNSLDSQTKQTLWDHVKQVFDNIREFFSQMLSSYKSDSAEAKAIRQNMEEFEKIRNLWNKALNEQSAGDKAEYSIRDLNEYDTSSPNIASDTGVQYSTRITDESLLKRLNDEVDRGDYITTYKAMQLIDGKLYPPMAAKVKGEDGKYRMQNPSMLKVWQQADEDPAHIKIKNGRGYYVLNKGNGKSIEAAYNPYEHSSNLVLNDQFEEAYKRDNLVFVECRIPKSEIDNPYRAEYAKDSTGVLDWKAGTVAGKLKDNKRQVYLSRYLMPYSILEMDEVARMWKDTLGDSGIEVPFNVVPPKLLTELEKIGVPIDREGSPLYKAHNKPQYSTRDSSDDELTEAQAEYFKDSKIRDKKGNLQIMYHGTNGDFNIFDPKKMGGANGTAEGFGIYLSDRTDVSDAYGDRLIKAYVNVKKPATSTKRTITRSALKKLIKATAMNEASKMVTDGDYKNVNEAVKDSWISNYTNTYEKSLSGSLDDVVNQMFRMDDNDMGIIQEVMAGMGIRNYEEAYDFYDILKRETGFDGFETWWTNNEKPNDPARIVLAFDSNQVKNTDNLNPTENSDIRYSTRDSSGRDLTTAQAEYFRDSKARDAEGRLLTLYHGTASAGFTEFRGSVWLTTSKRDADSYGGNWEGKAFDPDEKPEVRKTAGKTYPVGEHMRFESKEDRDAFLKSYPDAESYLTEREYIQRQGELDGNLDADDYDERSDELQRLRRRSEQIERAYAGYERNHSASTTIGAMLEEPSLYSLNDFKRAWTSIDREASFDDEFDNYDSDEEYRDALADRLRRYITEENADDPKWQEEMLSLPVKARIPKGRQGEIFNSTNNRTYELYANVVNPFVFDNHGRGSEGNGTFHRNIEKAMADPQYDGVIALNARVGQHQDLGTVVVAKNSNQVKLASNQNPTADNDIRRSQRNVDIDARIDALVKKYGAMPTGEHPQRSEQLPKQTSDGKNLRRFARTVWESGIATDDIDNEIKKAIIDESLSYEVKTDEEAAEYASSVIRIGGTERAQKEWDRARRSDTFNKDHMALGQFLLKEYAKNNDVENAMKMIQELAAEGTRMGQNIQAMRMLKKYSQKVPAIGLGYIQRTVDQMNRDAKRKMGKKFQKMEIDQKLADAYLNAKTQDEIDSAIADIYIDLGSQVQKTTTEDVVDRLRTWRYMAMLGNPRTHIRNLVGNALFVPAVQMKNAIGAGLEGTMKTKTRTKAVRISKEAAAFAKQDALEMKDRLSGRQDLSIRDLIMEQRKVFSSKALNTLSEKNSQALETEDWIFLRRHYENSLAQYITANKLDTTQENPAWLGKAREYAVLEAQKATYRDANKVSAWLNQSGKAGTIVKYMMEGMLPFKKTPTNILRRGVEYSPAGLVATLTKGTRDLNTGKITVNEWIDGVSAGLTGTAIFGLGMFLASTGAILGGYDDDDDKELRKLKGLQEYSVRIGNKTYTIDWAAPGSLPLFIGVETMSALQSERGVTMDDMGKSVMRMIDPMINMSMLSGLNDTLDAISYSENKLSAAAMETFYSLLGQYVPTLFGQVARTIDTTQRINYQDKNKGMSKDMLYFIEKMQNKIPFLTFSNDPYLNEFGQENDSGPHWAAALQNFVSPGYISSVKDDKVINEIERLQGAQEENVLPKKMPKYLGTKENRVDLTSEQYTLFQRTAGQTAYNILDRMIADRRYDRMNADEQAAAIKMAYDYAKAVGRIAVQPEYESDLKGDTKKIYNAVKDRKQAFSAILDLCAEKKEKKKSE